ncbi:MAG: recG [Solimicrobium sp.]|jgi:ATP-dependent DNA helicase RecG|nr:recG [Solimicrobium sp.]
MPVELPSPPAKSKLAANLAKLGLYSDIDLVLHLPMRYVDETQLITIQRAGSLGGEMVQVEGLVTACEVQYKPRRQLLVTIADDSSQLVLRFLHFYGNQITQLAVGNRVRARAEIRHGFFGPEMVHPEYKVVNENTPLPVQLTPIYPSGVGISQTTLRRVISAALQRINWQDTLTPELRDRFKLVEFDNAVKLLHNPSVSTDMFSLENRSHAAWRRMKFDELLAQQLSLQRAQFSRRRKSAPSLAGVGKHTTAFLRSLPFALTCAQQRVLEEIRTDIGATYPMQRLLQGDVGCGKTIVAALAATQAIDNGYQATLMAPTEILADQHFRKIAGWLEPLGISVVWLTGSLKKKEKQNARDQIESGTAQLVIGTHALLQDNVKFARLGLVIVDEQHRFGVDQRLTLRNKGNDLNFTPHQLMMSATPIPRTLAMTYYADLEISVIDELPPGRSPIMTRVIDQERRSEVINRVGAAAADGRQIYWVCPLIEESEALQLQTATDTHSMLQEALPELKIGLVHGRMKPAEKQTVMADFISGTTQLLVATTVIEVGVDVPNASLMVIEHAERFGLSQLHQLRGRVGRGTAASVCLLLFQAPLGGIARQRLMTMRSSTDGFEIARKDLEIRGPGEFLGARQAGQAMLRFADLETDQELVEQVRGLAQKLLEDATHNLPEASEIVEAHLLRWMNRKEEYLRV